MEGGIILFIDGLFCRRSNAGADTAGAAGLNVSTEPGPGFCIRRIVVDAELAAVPVVVVVGPTAGLVNRFVAVKRHN